MSVGDIVESSTHLLRSLLSELFASNIPHLRRLLAGLQDGVLERLPDHGACPAEFIDRAVEELLRCGLAPAIMTLLAEEFPLRRVEVEQARERMLPSLHASAADHSAELDGYLARVRERCRFIRCVGLGSTLPVQLPIDGFYVPLRLYLSRSLEGRDAPGRFDADVLARGELVTTDVPLEDALRTAVRFDLRGVVLLGDPGAGKTTAARYLAWRCANDGGTPLGLPAEAVPVLLSLRRCRPELLKTGLMTWCSEEWSSPHAPDLQELVRRLVRHGPVLWILDGLDEIACASTREAASLWIRQAMLDRPYDAFIITSRYAGYSGDALLLRESFIELHLQPLDAPQGQTFIRRWFQCVESHVRGTDAVSTELAQRASASLIASLDGRDLRRHQLGVVASNPLLLSILCLVHRRSAGASLRRADLYRQCVEVLLEHWLHGKWVVGPTGESVYGMLGALAWELHRSGGRTELAMDTAAVLFSEEELALLARVRDDSGLVVTSRPGHLAFLHLTFQEYFAAMHAHERGLVGQLVGRFGEAWWREVLLLFSGLAGAPAMRTFVVGLLQTDALEADPDLFAQCLDAAEVFPLEPLLEQLALAHEIELVRLRGLLRLVRDRSAPELLAVCRGLLQHEDGGVVGLALEILGRADVAAEVAAPEPRERDSEATELELVEIPGGSFIIGSAAGHANERPRSVTLAAFAMSRYLVTNAQYRRFLNDNPDAALPRYWLDPRYNGADQPVVGVSWHEAARFCAWAGVELPNEAQWEVACRAGTSGEYWSGDGEAALRRVGWYHGNAEGRLHAVGRLPANPFGLFDMHGSVWEWCDEWYTSRPDLGVASAGGERVCRGGYWGVEANRARSSYRGRLPPKTRGFDVGFRVVARAGVRRRALASR